MRRILAIGTFVMLGAAGVAQAGVSATVTAVSDYDFRGISLTARDPALQASVDYANDNGFYAGIWASNAAYEPGSGMDNEVDYYKGYGRGPEDGVQWNAFLVYYTDPGAKPTNIDYAEANIGVTYKWFNFQQGTPPSFNSSLRFGYSSARLGRGRYRDRRHRNWIRAAQRVPPARERKQQLNAA